MQLWITDPKTKEPSVSLSLLIVTFVGTLVAAGLQMAGKIESTSIMTEMFYGNVALYFGRKFTVGKTTASSEKTEGGQA